MLFQLELFPAMFAGKVSERQLEKKVSMKNYMASKMGFEVSCLFKDLFTANEGTCQVAFNVGLFLKIV